jgi:predicted DNA-binding transcriptional regulator AlpA
MPIDTDVIDRPATSERQRRQFQSISTVLARLDLKSAVTLWRRMQADPRFPQPVEFNGYRYWYEDEIDEYIANQPRGRGFNPVAAREVRQRRIAEARRQERCREAERRAENVRLGRTPRFGFVRGN